MAAELKSVCETESLALSSVKKWCQRFTEGRTLLYGDLSCGRPLANDLTEASPSMLKKRPYLSCKVRCRYFPIEKEACFQILRDTLGVNRFHLRWVPHALDTNQKAERVTLSYGILSVLQNVRPTRFQSVITGDEPWFFLCHPGDSIFNMGIITR
jgi:hypothetical protein